MVRPKPILDKNQLDRLNRRPLHLEVRVPPVAELFVPAEILITDIQPSEKCLGAINHHDFPMVAEIELQP